MSFSGRGRPFFFRYCLSLPYSRATSKSAETMALPDANRSTLAVFSDGRQRLRGSEEQLAERNRGDEYFGRKVKIGKHRVLSLQEGNDDVRVEQESTIRRHQCARDRKSTRLSSSHANISYV